MKWKTGAALMVVVLLIAMIPAAVSALKTGGLPSFAPKPDSHQLVLQIDNSAALKDGEVVNLDDGKGNAITPYIDESGNMLVPIRPPLTQTRSNFRASLWITVGNCFFIPSGLQPPRT